MKSDTELPEESGNEQRIPKIRLSRNATIFLIFVGIATLFWFLKALEKIYFVQIDHPVIFQNMPDNMTLANELPKRLVLEVQGTGFAILRHNWDISKNPVRLNLKQYSKSTKQQGQNYRLTVQTNLIKNLASNQLNNLTVTQIIPDSLVFLFSKETSKKVPVFADIEVELEKQFMIADKIRIKPDSITITGPAALIDTIPGIKTIAQSFRRSNKSITKTLDLIKPDPKVELSSAEATIEIPIEQFTEKSLQVQVVPVNVPDSLIIKVFPASVQVTFRIAVSAFERIQPQDFMVTIDYLDSEKGIKKLPTKLHLAPAGIELPRIYPERLDYLIEVKW